MSIQSIQTVENVIGKYKKRELETSSTRLIINSLTVAQYNDPLGSAIREYVSNAVDAINEARIAIGILTGKLKKEDIFIERNEAEYKASNFDPSYYDLNWIETTGLVEIFHEMNQGTEFCDNLSIRDNGVGISPSRLEGYFKIGYSTKRNTTEQRGAYGYGAKASLSLMNEYFITETSYNGMLFRFQQTENSIISLVSKFDDKGNIRDSITFSDGYVAYYEKTTQKNFTKISFPLANYHRKEVEQSIKSQLLYFKENIIYREKNENGLLREIPFKAEIFYNSKNIIISNNNHYRVPHIIITTNINDPNSSGICYGVVNFDMLGITPIHTNIGFKVPIRQVIEEEGQIKVLQEGVDITPSRESVIWSKNTRDYIKGVIQSASEEASSIVSKELEETNLHKWLIKANSVLSNSFDSGPLSRLSKLIDKSTITPVFKKDNVSVKYGTAKSILKGFDITVYSVNQYVNKTKSGSIVGNKDDGFYAVEKLPQDEKFIDANTLLIKTTSLKHVKKLAYIVSQFNKDRTRYNPSYIICFEDKGLGTFELLPELDYLSYDDFEIPENWDAVDEDQSDAVVIEDVEKVDYNKIRKEEKKLLVNKVYKTFSRNLFDLSRAEMEIEKIKQLPNLYWGTFEETNLVYLAAFISKYITISTDSNDYNFLIVSQQAARTLQKEKVQNIQNFFYEIDENGTMQTTHKVKKYLSYKHVKDIVEKLTFLKGFKTFNIEDHETFEAFHKEYKNLTFDLDLANDSFAKDPDNKKLMELLEGLFQLQLNLFNQPDINKAEVIEEFIGMDIFQDLNIVDLEMIEKITNLWNKYKKKSAILNNLKYLSEENNSYNQELEQEIREFISDLN